jgi:DNA-binding NarL/FixJ family response regulator
MPAWDAGQKAYREVVAPSAIVAIDAARAAKQRAATTALFENTGHRRRSGNGEAKFGGFIAVIDSRTFIGECIRRSVRSAFALPVLTYSTAAELEQRHLLTSARLVIFSLPEDNEEVSANALKILPTLAPKLPVIVLASTNDFELARRVICHGAKGYIPVTTRFEVVIEAVRFVLAGGTYAPIDCPLASDPRRNVLSQPPGTGLLTDRELAVTQAIQKGKSNKVIAYQLTMSESTVKVHIRNIMRKLRAVNRTDVAIKAQTTLGALGRADAGSISQSPLKRLE